ncbi:XRE family transcriptional regulator [uncultured Desulfovibrio sp.]|uniref:XRE family transcriptional regulator n=1 Tax=uncultured Desulfovibrio sp. TaxID=167968 RepID=UPI0025881D61|nr:XRE family transcriptional regulator [uncultured Desulfovibrio sp.]
MTTDTQNRPQQLRAWMKDKKVTDVFVAQFMDVSPQAVNKMLKRPTIRTDRHKVFVELGFPVELLPRPENLKPGPRPKIPELPVMQDRKILTSAAGVPLA